MQLRTDDDIHRVPLRYLGPENYTLPVQLTFAQWGLFACCTTVSALLISVVAGAGDAVWFGACLGAVVSAIIWRHVDPDRPARKVLRTVVTDWRRAAPDPQAGHPLPRRTARHLTGGSR